MPFLNTLEYHVACVFCMSLFVFIAFVGTGSISNILGY